jgi:cyclophilin family peptidyl-prolyl cis-trans isomerase
MERRQRLVACGAVGTDKRERKKVNRQARLEAEKRETRRANLIRRVVFIAVLTVGILALALLINLFGGDGDDTAVDEGAAAPTTETTEPPATECPAEDGSSPQRLEFDAPPELCIDPTNTYRATVETTEGEFVIDLDAENAPRTVNNFVVLSRYHFYDDVAFHRIVPGFVVQGGDPVGDPPGTGGPGYRFADELPEPGAYELGSVAMANSGPDTNGSQFFVVTGERGTQLPPDYSLFGTVTEGFEVVQAIEAAGPDASPAPRIVRITITGS